MGWIAALKQGVPSEGKVEKLTYPFPTNLDPSIAFTTLDGTGATGTTTLNLTKPSSFLAPGFIKTVVRLDATAQAIIIDVAAAVRGDENTADQTQFLASKKGGVARYVLSGDAWFNIPGGDAAADLDITIG